MLDKKCALLLNFTANTYHWGCYGTSLELYETLIEKGYYINYISVTDIQNISPSPESINDFDDIEFANKFYKNNRSILTSAKDADVIISNGEGTLHGLEKPVLNLLYLMYSTRKYFNKPVFLINSSCYPTDGDPPSEPSSTLYGGVLRALNRVVVREARSAEILRDLGVKTKQGFDCLPRFIARRACRQSDANNGPLLLSGGVVMTGESAFTIASVISRSMKPGQTIRYLSGAKNALAPEDMGHAARMREAIPAMEIIVANSMSEWLDQINQASCLISGRFHHTLAAVALNTPIIAFPSNTPKITAICDMLGLSSPISYDAENFDALLEKRLKEVSQGESLRIPSTASRRMLELAARNFEDF